MRRAFANFGAAIVSLRKQWQRSLLSALGVTVGALAIVLLVSIAKGVQADIAGQVQDIGINILIVIPERIDPNGMNPNMFGQSFLSEEDAVRLAQVPGVVRTTPWAFIGGGIRYRDKSAASLPVATMPAWFQMHATRLQYGRIFDQRDDSASVCVLGSVAKDKLFGKADPIGKLVDINGHKYTVVGVTEDNGAGQSLFSMASVENLVYVPYHTLTKLEPTTQTQRIMVQVRPDAEPKSLIKRLDAVLGARLDRQQFMVLTQEDLLGLVYKLMGILTWLLIGLTSIGLFVGGVGIMTVMLMSVNERSKEIGIRKAVGARTSDIFAQFLGEAICLALTGGIAGLALGYGAGLALMRWTPIKPVITVATVALAFFVCVFVGAIFGLIPAVKAARKEPVDALRNE